MHTHVNVELLSEEKGFESTMLHAGDFASDIHRNSKTWNNTKTSLIFRIEPRVNMMRVISDKVRMTLLWQLVSRLMTTD